MLTAAGATVLAASREAARAEAFCDAHGGTPVALDRDATDLASRIGALAPAIVVDAAGPFHGYGHDPYRVARAAIAAGAHYLDLSDDAPFTVGIGVLDAAARAAGVSVLSGVSSVPALSSAVAGALCEGLAEVHLIESVILPGNRAPRGRSVMASILAQVGRPLTIIRAGRPVTVHGWTDLRTMRWSVPGRAPLRRPASFIGAPDLALFADHFGARSVVFRAGLDLRLFHHALGLAAPLVRAGLLPRLDQFTRLFGWIADRFEGAGSDRGGMVVDAVGVTTAGAPVRRRWGLIVEDGDGPNVPALPGLILCAKLARGEVQPGARPCLAEFGLAEAEDALASLDAGTHRTEAPAMPLFAQALGARFAALPAPVGDLHAVLHARRWAGRGSVARGSGLLARIAGLIGRFPPAMTDAPVSVEMIREGEAEVWHRDFGGHRFRSVLTGRAGGLRERFGPFVFDLAPQADEAGLSLPIVRGRFCGVPIPRPFLPISDATERADADGDVRFDVGVSLPLGSLIVRYEGVLSPVA